VEHRRKRAGVFFIGEGSCDGEDFLELVLEL